MEEEVGVKTSSPVLLGLSSNTAILATEESGIERQCVSCASPLSDNHSQQAPLETISEPPIILPLKLVFTHSSKQLVCIGEDRISIF
jgi:hypothetical protein